MSLLYPKFINEVVPLTIEQKKTARKMAWRKWRSQKWHTLIFLAVLITMIIIYSLFIEALENYTGSKLNGWPHIMSLVGFFSITWMSYRLLQHFCFASHYRLAVRELGYDVCVGCGYWLRGLDKSVQTCPECGFVRTFIYKRKSNFKWNDEHRRRLQAIGFDQCRNCTAIFNIEVDICPQCLTQRELLDEPCEDK